MTVIYPERCRNTTAGAMRQIKQQGYSIGSKPLFSVRWIECLAFQTAHGLAGFFNKREPAGQFMEALERNKQLIEDNTKAIRESAHRLVDTAREANKSMTEVSGKMRDGCDKLGSAIDKFMKVACRPDFEKQVHLTTTLVASLEKLSVLEERGVLDRVLRSLSGGK